ncbi:MAG: metallophosphoesterase [Spirochaetota bacterium]
MNIGIISDTHENMPLIAQAVELFNAESVDLVLHAGDFISPITSREFENLRCKMIAVYGNNDGDKLLLQKKFEGIAQFYEHYYEAELDGKKLVVMHEPKFLESLMKAGLYDAVIYGHTHKLDIREGKPLVINPGECGGWLTGKTTVAVLDLEKMEVDVKQLKG